MWQASTAVGAHHDKLAPQVGRRFDDHLGGGETTHHMGCDVEPWLDLRAVFKVSEARIVARSHKLLEPV